MHVTGVPVQGPQGRRRGSSQSLGESLGLEFDLLGPDGIGPGAGHPAIVAGWSALGTDFASKCHPFPVERMPFSSVDELIEALHSLEGQSSDDDVAALPHLLQTGELLVRAFAKDRELIAAGLVHDIASAMGIRSGDHAQVGAELVTPLLGERVGAVVAGHTEAKRYLVTMDQSYEEALSPNSTLTLSAQGGPMTRREVAAFKERREWRAMVALRRADDAAKVPDVEVRSVMAWRELLVKVAHQASTHN